MKLKRVTITGYRSIRKRFDLDLDDRITVILGANDHGKTNLLNALLHLNPDHPFSREDDLNWDHPDRAADFPDLRFTLELSSDERRDLRLHLIDHARLGELVSHRVRLEA